VAYGKVYFGAHDGLVRALDADSGALIWSQYINTGASANDIYSSPTVANGVVYIGSLNNNLYALDANDGSILWTYATGGPIAYSSASINGDELFIGSRDNKLYAFGSDTNAPTVPASLDAVALPSSSPTYVHLTWLASSDEAGGTGVRGYNIYRSNTSGEGYAKINSLPINATSTNDSSVINGNNYYYKVTVVDNAGNESGLSPQASAPNLLITKTMSVEAPTSGGYSGGANDAVPGATITYNINYSNNGFAPATFVVMVDRVPDFTEYAMGSATGEAVSSIVFSNNNGLSYTYSPSGTYVDPAVTNVKWLCNDLEIDHASTVKFKVVIK
jgi:uncharacterized repeat protein (TIGR01451 family)